MYTDVDEDKSYKICVGYMYRVNLDGWWSWYRSLKTLVSAEVEASNGRFIRVENNVWLLRANACGSGIENELMIEIHHLLSL